MAKITEVRVPDIGDFKGVEVVEVLVKPGDTVQLEDPLLTLESDKASMDVPAPVAGVVTEVKVKVGDQIAQGDLILLVEAAEGQAAPSPAAVPVSTPGLVPAGIQEIRVPDIGDFRGVEVVEVLIASGDLLSVEQPVIILESDKASMEVPSPQAGVVTEVRIKAGDQVSQGDLIALIRVEGAEAVTSPANDRRVPSAPPPAVALGPTAAKPSDFEARRPAPIMPPPDEAAFIRAYASPSVRKFARELGVDLGRIGDGSGRKGRITHEDVQSFVKRIMTGETPLAAAVMTGTGIPPIPPVDFTKFGEIETQPLSKIKRLTGQNLSRNWLNLPHVTHHDDADITDTEAFRQSLAAEAKQKDIRVTLLSFLLKASAASLKAFPMFNASLDPDGEHLILKKYVHIGVAVDTPEGLVVPVIRDVDQKSLFELSVELADYSAKARAKKLMPGEMQGACFTLSSLGGIGGRYFTPIINAPEVAILGVTRAEMKPVWNGREFMPRLMLPLSLSYDHRVIDGAQAARFVNHLAGLIADVRRLLL